MSGTSASDPLPPELPEDFDELLERFELAWGQGAAPRLDDYLDMGRRLMIPPKRVLDELVAIDLEYRWRARPPGEPGQSTPSQNPSQSAPLELGSATMPSPEGGARPAGNAAAQGEPAAVLPELPRRPRLEDYLRRWPQLQVSADLAAEEYRVRQKFGDRPRREEYLQRFPWLGLHLPAALAQADDELAEAGRGEPRLADTSPMRPNSLTERSHGSDVTPVSQPRASQPRGAPLPDDSALPVLPPEQAKRYQLRALLGQGAFGAVYRAFDTLLKRDVAIKIPHARFLNTPDDVEFFLAEAQTAAGIRHPNLVSIFDVFAGPRQCFIVMEYVAGQTLRELMSRPLPSLRIAEIVAQAAGALAAVHRADFFHRDLKPGNILIDGRGRPYVTDFGLAIRADEQRRRAGEICGTAYYMSPEQVRGDTQYLDGRTDIWSLGVILYELLCGRYPFGGQSRDEVFDEILHRDPRPPRQINDQAPAELERICLKCLFKDVGQRYPSADVLDDELRAWLAAQRTTAAEGAPATPARSAPEPAASAKPIPLPEKTDNLPPARDPFVGRETEAADLLAMFADEDVSLLTLLGPGGIGKTRLALEVGREQVRRFRTHCWWVELSAARTESDISQAVLHAWDVPVREDQSPAEQVAAVLELRPPTLLILDNLEQAIAAAPRTIGLWRQRAPHVFCLVTSRIPLGLKGEKQFELSPLPAPPTRSHFGEAGESAAVAQQTADEARQFASVRLFEERARDAEARFAVTDDNAADVAEICARLEGVPLLLELAASRIKVLQPAQIRAKLNDKFKLLRSTAKDLPARQQTLAGAIDWSYDVLAPWERSAFLQACVFPGGFSVEAAEEVLDLSEFDEAPLTMDVVQSLREQSMLRALDVSYERRFQMYESVRQYGLQKRAKEFSPQAEAALRRRLAAWQVDYAERWTAEVRGSQGAEALDRLGREIENLAALQHWAQSAGPEEAPLAVETLARAVAAITPALEVRAHSQQRIELLEHALRPALPPSLRVRLTVALSSACQSAGQRQRAQSLAEQALELAETSSHDEAQRADLQCAALLRLGQLQQSGGDAAAALDFFERARRTAERSGAGRVQAQSLAYAGLIHRRQGRLDEALEYFAQAADMARSLDDYAIEADVSRLHGQVLLQRGDFSAALQKFASSEKLARQRGDRRALLLALISCGAAHSAAGDYPRALACYEEAETLARQLGEQRFLAMSLSNRGVAHVEQGSYEAALRCFQTAEEINRRIGNQESRALNVGNRALVQAALGQFDAALASLEEAAALNEQAGSRYHFALNSADRGEVLLRMARLDEAMLALVEATGMLDELRICESPECFIIQATLADVYFRSGRRGLARSLAAEAAELADKLRFTPEDPRVRIREALQRIRQIQETP